MSSASCNSSSLNLTNNKILEKPDNTTLSFWITQEVSQDNFKDCEFLPGLMGGDEYLDSRYEAVVTEDEEGYKTYSAPAVSVVYTTSGYPDYSSTTSCVTRIVVTDPEITVYGLTMNPETDDKRKTMKSYKFKQNSDSSFSKNNCTVRFEEDRIYLGAVVTNVNNVVF